MAIDRQNADQLLDGETISSKHDIGHLSGNQVDKGPTKMISSVHNKTNRRFKAVVPRFECVCDGKSADWS